MGLESMEIWRLIQTVPHLQEQQPDFWNHFAQYQDQDSKFYRLTTAAPDPNYAPPDVVAKDDYTEIVFNSKNKQE